MCWVDGRWCQDSRNHPPPPEVDPVLVKCEHFSDILHVDISLNVVDRNFACLTTLDARRVSSVCVYTPNHLFWMEG